MLDLVEFCNISQATVQGDEKKILARSRFKTVVVAKVSGGVLALLIKDYCPTLITTRAAFMLCSLTLLL